MLQAINVSLQYGSRVLFKDVNLKFTKGNCYGVIGANGAGKSTFLKILSGKLEPNKGEVIKDKDERLSVLNQDQNAFDNETVIRTSAGATAYMPVIKVSNLNQTLEDLKKKNVWVYAADMDGSPMGKTNLKGDIALVVGGEGTGVRELTKKLCDGVISIPMFGKVNSLNASVSAGIVLYEAVRQRI